MAVLAQLGYMAMAVYSKRLRNRGVSSRSLLAVYGLLSPIWLLVSVAYLAQGFGTFTPVYFLLLILWIAVNLVHNLGTLYLSRYHCLSELLGYRFGFTTLWALFADVLLFREDLNAISLIVLPLLFVGGLILSFSRQNQVEEALRMPVAKKVGLLAVLTLASVVMYSLFKHAAQTQDSYLFHNVFFQTLLFPVFFVVGGKSFLRDVRDRHIPASYIIMVCLILFGAVLLEGVALAALPVTLMVMMGVVSLMIYAIHDLATRELPLTLANITATILIAAGLVVAVASG